MTADKARAFETPRDCDLRLRSVSNRAGIRLAALPNGALFSIEHHGAGAPVCVNQILGSPLAGAVGGIFLRVEGEAPVRLAGVGAALFGVAEERFVWESRHCGLACRLTLSAHPTASAWLWRLDVANESDAARALDVALIQDIGLGSRGFLMNNEAYASQYIDHFIATHARFGPVVMSRQNLAQDDVCPFVMHGCLDGAAGFATDGKELFGPAHRDRDGFGLSFGTPLTSRRLQHEMACVAILSGARALAPGESCAIRFFGLFAPDQPLASSVADLARLDALAWARMAPPSPPAMAPPERSLLAGAQTARADALDAQTLARLYPDRFEEEGAADAPMSFFAPDGALNRHVVLRDKERIVTRRHGAILRSGAALLPDESTLCVTAWMHGVFAAQLTIGNTSFHKLFSVSRDPYNVTRGGGLRMLVEIDGEWRLLAVPSAFEIGLNDCRWLYRFGDDLVRVSAEVSGLDAGMVWRVEVEGAPKRFLAFGQLVLGEREYEHAGRVEIDAQGKRISFRPDPRWLWGERRPAALYLLLSATPDEIEAIGGDELLFADGAFRNLGQVALRTRPTRGFSFAVVGSMTQSAAAQALAARYARNPSREALLAPARDFWRALTRGARVEGDPALDAMLPWLAHDALIHLTAPHGLEQYTGAAWGVRDVCQGPIELMLALRHDAAARDILRLLFAQQYEETGDWPQWFMLDPYAVVQDRTSHGDVIVWPLKAVNDYVEATGDVGFLDEEIAWRRRSDLAPSTRRDRVLARLERLIETARSRFVPGTSLVSYGEGDWNDSLQPADPELRDRMVSSWTVALLHQQLARFAAILARTGRDARAVAALADAIRADFQSLLIRDGVVAGYGVFGPDGGPPDLLLHPRDRRTGLSFSLLPMERAIVAGLFTPEQTARHMAIIREHLLFSDGVRLMDRPVAYRGGPQTIFRRAESSSFFGREIGLMYTHEHLRFAEALDMLGERDAFLDALARVNPVCAGRMSPEAAPRQRNAFFSSSDAAFADRYAASEEWDRLRAGEIGLEGGWRIYSSGPGIFLNLLVTRAFGRRRLFGEERREAHPGPARLRWDLDAEAGA